MEQTFYYIVIGALIVEYLLSTISAILNVNSITEELPSQFIDCLLYTSPSPRD